MNTPMKTPIKQFLCALSLGIVALTAQAESLLIKGADVYTSDKLLPATDIYINGGRIEALGSNLSLKADRTIDAKGKSVTAGLFNSRTHLGVVEVDAIAQTVDFYTTNTQVTAALKVADAFNPQSTLLPHNRAQGLTHALVVPESGTSLFAGQVALVQLGVTPKVIHESLGVAVDFTDYGVELAGASRAAALAVLRQALDDARDFTENKRAALAGDRREYSLSMMDLAALEPVVKGQQPLIVNVHRAADIKAILKLAKNKNVNVVLAGVSEGWQVAADIAANGTPVIMDPINNLPGSYESLGSRLDNAKLLSDAGVTLMFTGMSWHNTHNAYLVRQSAARFFNAPVAGDVMQGGLADLVLWTGDPLEVTSEPELVIVAGNEVSRVTRATMLRDRYFERLMK